MAFLSNLRKLVSKIVFFVVKSLEFRLDALQARAHVFAFLNT